MEKQKVSFFDQRTIEWNDATDSVRLIDQTLLPSELRFIECQNVQELITAIKTMQIRGAPALGIAGAMGVALALKGFQDKRRTSDFFEEMKTTSESLKNARPTAVNLSWGVERAMATVEHDISEEASSAQAFRELKTFVKKLADQDVETNKKLSKLGQALIHNKASVLTHCN